MSVCTRRAPWWLRALDAVGISLRISGKRDVNPDGTLTPWRHYVNGVRVPERCALALRARLTR